MHTAPPSRFSLDETLAQTSLPPSQAKQKPIRILVGDEYPVKKPLELGGALGHAGAGLRSFEMPEELVGDVQRREHGEPHRIPARRRVAGGADFSVHVRGQAPDVLLVERAPDRVALAENLDGDAF